MYKNVLIATDGSEHSNKAVHHGVELAKSIGATVIVVTVTEIWSALEIAGAAESGILDPTEKYEALAAKSAREKLDAAEAIAKSSGINCDSLHVRDRAPAEGILTTAKNKGCDLIVMGTHGRRGLSRLFLGSQATEVLTFSEVPVLVVR
jgi:nucleotide-binding universal stress UspA family protein